MMKPWHELTSLPVQQVNKRAQGKVCAECDNFSQCPTHDCDWGVCTARADRWSGRIKDFDEVCWVHALDGADFCMDFREEA